MAEDFASESGGVASLLQAYVMPTHSQRTRRACPERSRKERSNRFPGSAGEIRNLGSPARTFLFQFLELVVISQAHKLWYVKIVTRQLREVLETEHTKVAYVRLATGVYDDPYADSCA